MWIVTAGLLLVWFVLKFLLGKGGYVHIILIAALSCLVVQLIAYRKTQYHKNAARQ